MLRSPPFLRGAPAFALLVAMTLFSIGCSSAWASTADVANELGHVARSEVLEAREDALQRAGRAVLEAGGDTEAIAAAVDARARDFDEPIAIVNLAIAVKDRYVALALDAVRDDLPDSDRAVAGRALRDFGAVYRERVVPLLESLGRSAPPFPVELEEWIAELLEGEPDAPRDDPEPGAFLHVRSGGVS